jgi:mannose-1-phosphate guanylyltransferase
VLQLSNGIEVARFLKTIYRCNVKAFLLAAGLGTRLRPLTDKTPKCLLPIQGKPILQIWLEHLGRSGVTEVLVNTHHLHQQVETFSTQWNSSPKLILSYEAELLGSAGTLWANRSFVENEEFFLVLYADNLTKFKVEHLVQTFQKTKTLGVIALHRSQEPWRCGIAEMNSDGWIQHFEEKPKQPKSNLANSGIYLFSQEALSFLEPKIPLDIAHDFIPKLVPRLLGYEMKDQLIDIGTIDSYQKVQQYSQI